MRAIELAEMLGSTLENADGDLGLSGISTLSEAGPHDVAFVTDQKYLKSVDESRAGVILLPKKLGAVSRPYIPLENVWAGVLATLKLFYPGFERREYTGVHPSAVIDPSARLAEDVVVGPHAVIGAEAQVGSGSYIAPGVVIGARCRLGERCIVYANAVLEAETVLGNGVIVQPGAVIGADGFKYEILDGRWTKIPQVGHVELADKAEVGANSCIDRASYCRTEVGPDTKIDNLVQIGHNTKIGRNCVIVSQAGIAGSTELGDHCILAAQSGVADNLKIGERVIMMARAGATSDLASGQTVFGMPAIPFRQEARIVSARKKLPDLVAEMAKLTRRVEELEERLAEKSQ